MPSIAFVQQTGNNGNNSTSPYTLNAPFITVTAGSLLVASVASAYINLGYQDITVSDTAGNTWKALTRYSNPGNSNGGVRSFYCLNALAGATIVSATTSWSGGSFAYVGITVAEFVVPSTLALLAYEATNVPFPGGDSGDIIGPTLALPGPGLLWSACCIENNHTSLDAQFVDLTEQNTGAFFETASYVINPSGPKQKRYNTVTAGSDNSLTLAAFYDTAGFAARPSPIRGKGASW